MNLHKVSHLESSQVLDFFFYLIFNPFFKLLCHHTTALGCFQCHIQQAPSLVKPSECFMSQTGLSGEQQSFILSSFSSVGTSMYQLALKDCN